jgi:hypothetical protein
MISNNYNFSVPSDDSRKLSFMIPLASHKFGFDYYELNPTRNGGVIFEIITSLGLKTIKKTTTNVLLEDLEEKVWIRIISETASRHFCNEEYIALKNGYTKTKVGCFGFLLLSHILIFYVIY